MIELANIRKAFNQGQHNEYWALKGIDLEIPPARVNVLKGPSGSGKTTLLTILGCLARPTEGRVRLKGEDISGLPERFLTEIRRSTFGFIFQQFNLVRGLSAIENIILPGYPTGTPRAQVVELATLLVGGELEEFLCVRNQGLEVVDDLVLGGLKGRCHGGSPVSGPGKMS